MQLGICAVSACLNAIVHFHICTVTVWSRAAHKRIECMPLIACICTTIRECNTTCAAFYFIVVSAVFFCGFTSYARRIKYKCANHAHSANCDSCDDATLHIIYIHMWTAFCDAFVSVYGPGPESERPCIAASIKHPQITRYVFCCSRLPLFRHNTHMYSLQLNIFMRRQKQAFSGKLHRALCATRRMFWW